MSWLPSFFQPSAAWLFALLIPIVVFYFLKLRRSRLEISSLALWKQVINDQRVNAPFQRFKRNILLLLQLLLLIAIALAAMQPYLAGESRNRLALPILVDCSASMGAVGEDGKTRLELAKAEIEKLIDGLLPNQQLTLIAVDSTSRRLTEFTDNKPLLRQSLADLQVQDVPSRIEDGLRSAQQLARTLPIEKIRFYSDGNLPTRPNPTTGMPMAIVDVDLPFAVDFFQIPSAGHNMGITAMTARRASLDRWDVFLRVDGSAEGSSEADVVLKANGETVGQEHVVLAAGESQRLAFSVSARTSNHLEAVSTPQGRDALTSDNRAWLDLPPGRKISVYCPTTLPVFRHALQAVEGVEVWPTEDGSKSSAQYDLLVSDRPDDQSAEAPVKVMIGVVPPPLTDLLKIEAGAGEVVDWQRNAQLLQHVQLKDVLLTEVPKKQKDVLDTQIEQLGFEILAFGNSGPLILRQRDGPRLTYSLLFHPDRSTLPYRVGFPVLVSNIVGEAMQQASLGELRAAATGVLPPLKVTPRGEYRVTFPDGRHDERRANDDGMLAGIAATRTGQYEIRSGSSLIDSIGVGLLDVNETSLAAVDKIHFNELSVEAQAQRLKEDKPLWTQLAFLALGLLLLEWWYFQKKPAGVPES